ncbi:MAG: OmpA family protein [Myxococcales bacterium]|nr:OmpA family protein [Myxococcales bacterium]
MLTLLATLWVCTATATVAAPDYDRDGVPDLEDDCPTDPGDAVGRGCPGVVAPTPEPPPPPARVAVQADRLDLKEPVFFQTGSARIDPRSFPLLDDAAAALLGLPPATRVAIEGHTDDRGRRAANVRLSLQRAQAVVTYLVKRGVPKARLSARGHGPDRPIAPNDTEAGRAQNRRVEVLIGP